MLSQAAIESVQGQEQVLGRDRERESGEDFKRAVSTLYNFYLPYLTTGSVESPEGLEIGTVSLRLLTDASLAETEPRDRGNGESVALHVWTLSPSSR